MNEYRETLCRYLSLPNSSSSLDCRKMHQIFKNFRGEIPLAPTRRRGVSPLPHPPPAAPAAPHTRRLRHRYLGFAEFITFNNFIKDSLDTSQEMCKNMIIAEKTACKRMLLPPNRTNKIYPTQLNTNTFK